MAMIERSPDLTSIQDKPNTQSKITKELLEGYLYGKKKPRLVDLQSKETTNRKRKWDGVEDEYSTKLQSLWCEECCKHIQDECPIHQLPQPKLTYAVNSFPPEVGLCTSTVPGYTYGACAAKPMPRGTWIGPYEGRRVYLTQIPKDQDNAHLWEIYENGKFSHFIDGSDESISSWMRFIRCARNKTEQNMSVIQYGSNIYYYALKDIEIGDEMLVWYHESYYQFWGVPLVLPKELDEKNGPPIPQGIQQPPSVKVNQTSNEPQINSSPASHSLNALPVTSRQSRKPSTSENVKSPHQYGAHKAFYYLQQITTSKASSSPSKLPYPPKLSPKSVPPDSSISPVPQYPPPGVIPYPPVSPKQYIPNVSPTHPALSKGSIPYPPSSHGSTPNPPQARNILPYTPMTHQSTSFAYSPEPRYHAPTHPGNIQYQTPSTLLQYQVRPTQSSPVQQIAPHLPYSDRHRPITHSMIPAKVQASPETNRSPAAHSPNMEALHIPSSPQRPTTSQIPQQLSPTIPSSSHIPHEGQQPTSHSPRPEQPLTIISSREQAIKAYYENNYSTGRITTVDRSLTSSEADQLAKAEVKENMPLGGTNDIAVIETEFNNLKHPQALKSLPLQNLTPSLHNKRGYEQADRQYNQVSSTVKCTRDKELDISWKCGQCGEMFAQQVSLRMHVCSKAPDNPFHCGHCSNTFATSVELREHVVTHSNDRPFKCGFCGRSFAGATTLGNHMRTHTGQRPYECKVCGQTFAIATQLSRHLKPPGECGLRQKELNGFQQNVDISVEQ